MADPESPRADVELTEAERGSLSEELDRREGLLLPRIVAAVERILADRLAAVQAERDELRQSNDWNDWACKQNQNLYAETLARAESAEAERDDLRARPLAVETLAERLALVLAAHPFIDPTAIRVLRAVRDDLRAVLASPSTHTQRDTEVES